MERRQFIKSSAIVSASAAFPTVLRDESGIIDSNNLRSVYMVLNTDKTLVGTLPVLRAFAGDHNDYVSPYVFFDEFGPVRVNPKDKPLRVDAHPHAGIIPTTYFLSGSGHHRDSLNYDFQIAKGDFMMFSSGRGAIHMEETGSKLFDEGGVYHGFQIWLNMPSKYKFTAPSTAVYNSKNMGHIATNDYTATIVMGELFGQKSSVETLFPVFYIHLKLNAGCSLDVPTDPSHNAFVYTINGSIETSGRTQVSQNQVVLFERGKSDIRLFAKDNAEVLLLGGKPHNEQVVAYGPFVMNSEAEIIRCFNDYRSGKMGNAEVVNGKR